MAQKKIVQIEDVNPEAAAVREKEAKERAAAFTVTEESKKKAGTNRLIAFLLWFLAIGFEGTAIWYLNKPEINTIILIALILADMALAIGGSLIWKKANRLDPASKKEKFKFFIQNQLGVFMAAIAFLPLLFFIFTNNNMDKKQKAAIAIVAVAAFAIAGYFGIDFNPPSVEEYAEQTAAVEALMGVNRVYWTKSGTHYHLYSDCYTINGSATTEIFEGTVAQARELKNIEDLCKVCQREAEKENGMQTGEDAEDEEESAAA